MNNLADELSAPPDRPPMGSGASITPYQRATIHSKNPLARLSHRARLREAMSIIHAYLPAEGCMLDFGCGQGELLKRVHAALPRAKLYGLDPLQPAGENYAHLQSPADCRDLSFDLITAFEVLEHLGETATRDFFAWFKTISRAGALAL